MRVHRVACALIMLAGTAGVALGQSVEVTFRWVPDQDVTRAFLPGEFNNWGPNNQGRIASDAPSAMTFDAARGEWLYTVTLEVGQTYQYKVHVHYDASGARSQWITDPLNPRSNPAEYNNSVVTIADPMVFQMARRRDEHGSVSALSAGVFGSQGMASVALSINGQEQDGLPWLADGVFHYELPNPTACDVAFGLTVTDVTGRVVSESVGAAAPTITDAPRPAGMEDGVTMNALDPSRATLSLFAPGKCYVQVIGDFNDWDERTAPLMYRDAPHPDSVHWWLPLEGLAPDQRIGYQYVIDGSTRIADMFSTTVLDPAHDAGIPASTYPDLKPYPHGRTQGHVSVFETTPEPYQWQHTDFEAPAQGELVIYELLLRDFVAAHDWTTLADTLDYLDRLGINAIELMPVAEFGGNLNWGYQPNFFFAPDKYYGPANDLKRFIDEAHGRGIAVILDVVYNHVDLPSPLVSLYGAVGGNPWINLPPTHAYNVFYDLNHEDTYTQYWLDRVNAYWLEEYRVDGFRFDLSKGFTQRFTGSDWAAWDSYDPSRVRLLKRMADGIWEMNPRAYIILEHWTRDREERELAAYGMDQGLPGMMVWANVTHPYQEAAMGYHSNSNFARAYFGPGGRGWSLPHVISYMESHDEQWLMYKMRQFGACELAPLGGGLCNPSLAANQGTYNVRNLPVALDRLKMAGAFHLLMPGPRMLWQFGELGYGYGDRGEQCLEPNDCPSFAPGRTDPKPIRWDYRDDELRNKLYRTWSALLQLRRGHEVFHSPDTRVTMSLQGPVKRVFLEHPTMSAEIIGNFGVVPRANTSQLTASPRYWHDFFYRELVDTSLPRPTTLMPGEFHVYTSLPVPGAPDGLITVGAQSEVPFPDQLAIIGRYPNPFRHQTNIAFALETTQQVQIEVFDVLGRRVATLMDDRLLGGEHTVQFDAAALPSGLYVVRVAGERASASATLMRLR